MAHDLLELLDEAVAAAGEAVGCEGVGVALQDEGLVVLLLGLVPVNCGAGLRVSAAGNRSLKRSP